MKIINYIKDKQILIAIFLLTIFLFYFAAPLLHNLCIFDVDDLNSTIDSYPLWKEENGRYVFHIISRFFMLHIPHLLGIHLQNAANTIGMVIYILILSSLFSVIALFYCINHKNFIVYSILWIFAGIAFYDYISDSLNYWTIFSFQYGYALASTFALLFLYFIYKYISEYNEKFEYSKSKLILICIIAFCAGNSTQIATYSIFVSFVLFGILLLVKNKFNFAETKQQILNKNTIPILSSYLAGFICMVACPGFWIEVSWRHTNSLHQIYLDFVPFVHDFIERTILDYQVIYWLIGFLLVALILKNISDKKNIYEIIFDTFITIIPIISVLAYFFTLILAGRTFPFENYFWLIEPFYHFYYKMIFCVVIALFIGKLFKDNKLYNNFVIIVFVWMIYTGIHGFNIDSILNKRQDLINTLYTTRQEVYECEKIAMTEIYKDVDIIIPESYNKKYNIYSVFLERYIPKVYGWKMDKHVGILDDETAWNHFYSIGGTITDEEKKESDFQRLFDKEFVLNGDTNEVNNNNSDI